MMTWLTVAERFLGHPGALRAILAGVVTSWVATQGWKYHPLLIELDADTAKWWTRVLAFAFGAGPVLCLWPEPGLPRWIFAAIVGLAAPVIYTIAMRIVYRVWPWLEPHVSARPTPPAEDD